MAKGRKLGIPSPKGYVGKVASKGKLKGPLTVRSQAKVTRTIKGTK
jgi:hypothetical protein